MIRSYHALGQVLSGLAPEQLAHAQSRQMLAACHRHPAFSVVELRKISNPSDVSKPAIDGIVVDCCDGTVPSRNLIGIHNKERLLLLHGPGLVTPHEVRALRTGFPATAHQNSIFNGEPTSLCLYFEPWSAVERTWTPEKHLQRILWWLRETSAGTLHRTDQPLERLHFVSPYQIVLPADFNERVARRTEVLHLACARSRDKGTMLRGAFGPRPEKHAARDDFGMDILVVAVPPALSTRSCDNGLPLTTFMQLTKENGCVSRTGSVNTQRTSSNFSSSGARGSLSKLTLRNSHQCNATNSSSENSITSSLLSHADILLTGARNTSVWEGVVLP